jgi:hypothetical protein
LFVRRLRRRRHMHVQFGRLIKETVRLV